MEEVFRPNHLLDYELEYELKIRAVVTQRNVVEKRKMLGLLLQKERDSNKFNIVQCMVDKLDFASEKAEIDRSLSSISDIISEFEGTTKDFVFLRMKSRLVHVSNRLRRLPIPENDVEASSYVQESIATCLALEADLYERVNKELDKEYDVNQPSTSNPVQQPIIILHLLLLLVPVI